MDIVIAAFVGGIIAGLAGRPLVVRLVRIVLGVKREAKKLQDEAERK